MRLCFFAPPLTYRGGVGNLSVSLIKHLARCSDIDEIFVVCDTIDEDARRSLKHKKVNIQSIGPVKRSDFLRVIVRNIRYMSLSDKFKGFDVFHVLDERVFPFVNPHLHPLVVTIHNVMMLEFVAVLKAVGKIGIGSAIGDIDLYLPQLPLEVLSATKARGIIVSSPLIAKQLVNLYGNFVNGKIRIISPGFDPMVFNPYCMKKSDARRLLNLDLSSKVLLHIGGVSRQRSGERKGLPYLLNALDCLRKNGYLDQLNILLLVLGEVGRKYRRLFPAIQKRIIELDEVKEDFMPTLYRASDVFVMPSISEGWGITLIEALACGTPVIASSFVPSAFTVKDLGDVHIENELNNPARFARSILQVLNGETFMVNDWNGIFHILARDYSWENYAKAHVDFYRQIISQDFHHSENMLNPTVIV